MSSTAPENCVLPRQQGKELENVSYFNSKLSFLHTVFEYQAWKKDMFIFISTTKINKYVTFFFFSKSDLTSKRDTYELQKKIEYAPTLSVDVH